MTHRADQIIDAVVAFIALEVDSDVSVYAHNRLSLSAEQDQVPAISVDFGEDVPYTGDGAGTLDGTIESLLTVNITCLATAPLEELLRRQLLALRASAHRGVKATRDLGLSFVTRTFYGGANPPEIDASVDPIIGELVCPWGVLYETSETDPEN